MVGENIGAPRPTASRAETERTCGLSVVLPCLNEAETLATCVTKAQRAMKELGVDGEGVVADNGSSGGPQEIARRLRDRATDLPVNGDGRGPGGGITPGRAWGWRARVGGRRDARCDRSC